MLVCHLVQKVVAIVRQDAVAPFLSLLGVTLRDGMQLRGLPSGYLRGLGDTYIYVAGLAFRHVAQAAAGYDASCGGRATRRIANGAVGCSGS
jgi:hypothetical protein